jgi:hypothetical protein
LRIAHNLFIVVVRILEDWWSTERRTRKCRACVSTCPFGLLIL